MNLTNRSDELVRRIDERTSRPVVLIIYRAAQCARLAQEMNMSEELMCTHVYALAAQGSKRTANM